MSFSEVVHPRNEETWHVQCMLPAESGVTRYERHHQRCNQQEPRGIIGPKGTVGTSPCQAFRSVCRQDSEGLQMTLGIVARLPHIVQCSHHQHAIFSYVDVIRLFSAALRII
jgi:hypothetical protein